LGIVDVWKVVDVWGFTDVLRIDFCGVDVWGVAGEFVDICIVDFLVNPLPVVSPCTVSDTAGAVVSIMSSTKTSISFEK
jgi:hypothetical protein